MKVILVFFVALFEVFGSLQVLADMSFNVSSMKGVEDIYFQMKRRSPSLRPPQEEKIIAKQELCSAILSSEFFDTYNLEVVDPDHPDIHDQVKKDHRKLHKAHYVPSAAFNVSEAKFANPYRVRDVSINEGTIPEFMFTCLAKNCQTKGIEQYFISPEYLTDASTNVRFVFTPGEKKNQALVIAMAEHSPHRATEPRRCAVKKPEPEQAKDEEDSSDSSSSW